MAEEAGMMAEGHAWIISDVLTSLVDSVDSTIEAMQGVLGVRPHIPRSHELSRFTKRWRRRFHEENPEMDRTELNVFGLWAYDSTTALADSVERVGVASPQFKKSVQRWNLTDLEAIGTSNSDPSLVHLIRNYKSKGLSGDFTISNGQMHASAFEIVNVVGAGANRVGFWTEKYGISQKLLVDDPKTLYSAKKDDLGGVVWPGRGVLVPRGWEVSTNGTKLKVGVTNKGGFPEFTKVERNSETNAVEVTGFCIDVFKQVMESLPYGVPYEFIPMDFLDHVTTGDYSDISIPTTNVVNQEANSFKGLFLVAGLSSSVALAVFVSGFVYENRGILRSTDSTKHKIDALARTFYQRKEGLARGRVSAASQEGIFVLPEDDWFNEVCQDAIEKLSGQPKNTNGERDLNSPTASVSAQSISSMRSHGSS
ncbi:glutamate receptor 2.2-like [Salvia hispanica]|uniref:glutamate receptor 2.2-like n=1 Tax=Salvia hispanica TaxID=49212 RepID=UPI0020090BBF|nr:glutamate receptor 2.2-like [Salvia hispanica]